MSNNMEKLPISVIIVAHNSEKVLSASLDAISKAHVAEVIIVDCGSTDSTPVIASELANSRIVSIGNEGYGRGNNAGFAVASQDHILILNPDVLIAKDQLQRLFEFYTGLSKPAIVAPKMYHHSGGAKVYRKDSRFKGDRSDVEKVCGAAMLMHRELYEQLGGFDKNIFLYFEETDLCVRAKKSGAEVLVCGTAEVEHFKSGSTPDNLKYEFLRGWHDGWSKIYFESKCADNALMRYLKIYKTLIQTQVKIITKGLSNNVNGQRRERNKLLGMKAFLRGEKAFDDKGFARFSNDI
jgi:GT2 family glycosyltransferase